MPPALDLLLSRLRRDLENAEGPLRSQLVLAYESAIYELEHDLFNVTWLIEDALSRGETISPDWLYRQDRYQRLIAKAEAQMQRFAGEALPVMERTFQSGTRLGAGHATPLLEAAGIQASFGTSINTPAVDKLYQTMFTQGSPLRDVLEGYGPHVGSVIRHEMGQGVIQSLSPREVVRNITQSLASGENRARLTTLTRTEMMRAYRLSQAEQLEPYAHAIKAYRWSAALQSRTCLACLAMDGQEFDEPQHKMHPNCRCICVPQGHYTPERYRRETGAEWLAAQPEATQRGMFPSQAAYEAYKRGELPLSAFVGERHSDVWGTSVTQLSGKQAMANAGLTTGGAGAQVEEASPHPTLGEVDTWITSSRDSYSNQVSGMELYREQTEASVARKHKKDSTIREWERYKADNAGYSDINGNLRTGGDMTRADKLREASINENRMSKDGKLYRGFSANPNEVWLKDVPSDGVGGIITDRGFVSTSHDQFVAERFADDTSGEKSQAYMMQIYAPKNTPAVGIEFGGYNAESEIVLAPGTRFGVIAQDTDDAGRIWYGVVPFPPNTSDLVISESIEDPFDAMDAAEKLWKKWRP